MESFTDIATASYCPRKLYYRRKHGDGEPPESVAPIRNLAFRYGALLESAALGDEPIAVPPSRYRERLERTRDRTDRWEDLVDPADRRVYLEGKDANGIAHKLLEDPPAPVMVSVGEPPDRGVWEPQSVRATAAAKALSWERTQPIEQAYLEYPAYGVVRKIGLSTRRKATYRSALRTAESLDGPPPRLGDDARCRACEYQEECGTKTRSLRSRLPI